MVSKLNISDEGLRELERLVDKIHDIEKKSGYRYVWVHGHHFLENIKTSKRTNIDKEWDSVKNE